MFLPVLIVTFGDMTIANFKHTLSNRACSRGETSKSAYQEVPLCYPGGCLSTLIILSDYGPPNQETD